jgi:hypothetical protein
MRDIRPDLRERKDALNREIQALEGQLRAKKTALENVDGLINEEEPRWAGGSQQRLELIKATPPSKDHVPDFKAFLQVLFKDGKPRTTQEIRDSALEEGFISDAKTAGRAVNFRLIGLERFGHVIRDEKSGKWMFNGS